MGGRFARHAVLPLGRSIHHVTDSFDKEMGEANTLKYGEGLKLPYFQQSNLEVE